MRRRQAGLTTVLGFTAFMVLTGCSDGAPEEPTAPAPSTEAPTGEPAPTTEAPATDAATTTAEPEPSAEEQDEADIEETLQLYTRALDDAFNGDA